MTSERPFSEHSSTGGTSRREVLRKGALITAVSAIGLPVATGSVAATACARTQGYWKNHTDWPGSSGHMHLGTTATDDNQYNYFTEHDGNPSLLEILEWPTKGDKSVIMAQQYIPAVLNGRNNAPDWCIQGYDGPRGPNLDPDYDESMDYTLMAKEFFDDHPPGSDARHWDGYEDVKDALEAYNEGRMCACHDD